MVEGADIHMTREEFAALIEAAAEKGARKALARVGLDHEDPEQVRKDISDLRNLIDGWRGAKKGILSAIVKTIGTAIGAALIAWIAFRAGVDVPKP